MSVNIINVLPAGEYRAVFSDAEGIYYEAPSKLIEKQTIAGMHAPDLPFAGGIFLERLNPHTAKIWGMSLGSSDPGRPAKLIIPESAIQFRLTR